jgi:hypothetical protein
MHTLADLIDAARAHSGIPSDRKLALALEVAPQQISQWRHGTHVPKGEHAIPLAKLSGLTEEYVLLCILNAEAKHGAVVKRMLRQIAGQLKKTAAALVIGIAAILGIFSPQHAQAHEAERTSNTYYGKF